MVEEEQNSCAPGGLESSNSSGYQRMLFVPPSFTAQHPIPGDIRRALPSAPLLTPHGCHPCSEPPPLPRDDTQQPESFFKNTSQILSFLCSKPCWAPHLIQCGSRSPYSGLTVGSPPPPALCLYPDSSGPPLVTAGASLPLPSKGTPPLELCPAVPGTHSFRSSLGSPS